MTQPTFEELQALVAPICIGWETLGSRLDHMLDRARINADDTVYLEKQAPEEEWSRIALDSLRGECCTKEAEADCVAWLEAHGLKF